MSDSIFGDLDFESVSDDLGVPANTYEATLFDVKVGLSANNKLGMTMVYKITSGEYADRSVQQWQYIPPANSDDPKDKTAATYLKLRLKSLGVPETKMNSVKPEDLMGIAVVIDVVKNGDYTNIKKVMLQDESSFEDGDNSMQQWAG